MQNHLCYHITTTLSDINFTEIIIGLKYHYMILFKTLLLTDDENTTAAITEICHLLLKMPLFSPFSSRSDSWLRLSLGQCVVFAIRSVYSWQCMHCALYIVHWSVCHVCIELFFYSVHCAVCRVPFALHCVRIHDMRKI